LAPSASVKKRTINPATTEAALTEPITAIAF